MVIHGRQIGLGIAALVIVAGVLGWLSRDFLAKPGAPAKPPAAHVESDAHGDKDPGQEAKLGDDAGHGHGDQGAKATANLDPATLQKLREKYGS